MMRNGVRRKIVDVTSQCKKREEEKSQKKIVGVILATSIYVLWNVPNAAKIDLIVMHPENVIMRVKSDVIRRIESLDLKTNCPFTREWIERLKL